MRANRSTWEILGSLLGLVILIVILNSAVGYYRQGSTDFAEQARVAGRPVTLTEVLTGNTGATEEITGTTGITGTADVTGTAAITETASPTATADLTTTVTNTDIVIVDATVGVTDTDAVTETNPVLASSDVTVTQDTPSTTQVTVTTTISEAADVAASSEATTTSVITSTNELTPTDALTTTSELTPTGDSSADATTPASTTPAEAPAELAAIFVKAGCIGCHVIPGVPNAVGMIGPNLTNIGADGATRIEGYSSEEYIRESLLDPNAFIAPECPTGPCLPNLMVQNLGEILTPEELDAVVAYLSVQGTTAQ